MATYTINKVKSPEGDIYNLQDASALHSIPVATTENVGGVKAGGTGISIDANGVISSTAPGQMVWYGTSNTSSGTASKTVVCSGFTLTTGAIIGVLFTTANTSGTLQLNVNSTGAKDVVVGHSAVSSTTNVLKWSANTLLYFMYNGTSFEYITAVSAASVEQPRGANTWYGTSSTAAGTTAKTSTIANYVLTKGSVVCVTFTYANTADAPTLNINSTGAKSVYYNNAVTSSSNKLTWDAGETVTFIYSGSYYYFVTKSKQQSGGITSESDPVYSASPAAGITASDITNWNSKGTGTVTSVRVRGTAPISSSVSTAQTGSLDTTISISDATTSASGAMSAADKTKLDKLTFTNTIGAKFETSDSNQVITVGTNNQVHGSITIKPTNLSVTTFRPGQSTYDLYPTTGTAPISVTNGAVSISDATTTASGAMSATDKTKLDSLDRLVWYGEDDDTPSGTAVKIIECEGFTLKEGSIIGVYFQAANTSNDLSLNINSTGVKAVYLGADTTSGVGNVLKWSNDTMVYFMYDGVHYQYITSVTDGSLPSSRGAGAWYGTSSTTASTAAKTSTVANFVRTQGALVSITFSTANTVTNSAITLNVNSTGAKTIYYNNAATSSSNTLLWDAGDTLTFMYTGSYYYFIAKSSGYMSSTDKSKLDKISFPESAISNINNLEFDCTPSDPGIRITANYGNDTYQSSLYYIANDGSSSGHGVICGTSDFVTPNTSCAVYDPRSTAGLARTETVGNTTRYVNGYMTGQDKEKLDKVIINIDNNVTLLTNGIKSNAVSSGDQSWRLFLGDYASTQNYGANSKTIMGLRGDNAVGDGLLFASYGTDGALDGKVAIGSTGIRSRDSSGSVAWDIDVPISAAELGHVTGTANSISLWRGWDNATFGDYMGIGAQNTDGTDGFRMYLGQNAWRFRTYVGTTGGADAWWMFPSRIPQFNNNTSATVSSVTSTYTYTGATSSSGTAYWYYYMDDSHIYGWVRLNCGNATSSTSKSTVLNLPTAFTSGITISTGTNDGGRFFITPFGTNGGTVDRMWVNAYNATTVTVNCTVASANTTAIPMNMMFFFNYTKNS